MNKKILAVDDDPDITKLIKLILESTGRYDVHMVNKSSEVITIARELMPDLIILDVMMPPPMGSEIANQLQSHQELKEVKHIFLTGIIDRTDQQKLGCHIGGHSFLPKPIRADELIRFIDEQF